MEKIRLWTVILGIFFPVFLGGFFWILTTQSRLMPVNVIISWTIVIIGFLGSVIALIYGFIVQPVRETTPKIYDMSQKIIELEEFEKKTLIGDINDIKMKIKNTEELIQNTYTSVAKELLVKANSFGFDMIYNSRTDVIGELSERLNNAKVEVKFLGICINIPFAVPDFNGILKKKASVDNVSFQFAFLKRVTKNGEIDFYKQRALDEYFPNKNMKNLKDTATNNINVLLQVKKGLDDKHNKNIIIKEYYAMPYMSMVVIDDDMYIGFYLFGENCPISPMYKLKRKEKGAFKVYEDHFKKLWDSSEETKELENIIEV